jgi:hypothetical protein
MITLKQRGSFKNLERFLKDASQKNYRGILDKYGRLGVEALAKTTPKDTGFTSESWSFIVTGSRGKYRIAWSNSNIVDGVPIAIVIEYGHGTANGSFVEGRPYINDALKPIFDGLASEIEKEVTVD